MPRAQVAAKRKALVKPVRRTAKAAGRVRVAIKPTKTGKARLRKTGRLRVRLRITFVPTGGKPASKTKTVTLKLKR